jgi:hypothetical protein
MEEQTTQAPVELAPEVEKWIDTKGRLPNAVKEKVVAARKSKKKQALTKTKENTVTKQSGLDAFVKEFVKNGGNATRAAMTVFNPKDRASAGAMGWTYLQKAKMLGLVYLESKGKSYGKLLDHAWKQMEDTGGTDWFDRVSRIMGADDFMSKSPQQGGAVINIVQAEKDILSKYVDGEVIPGYEEQAAPKETDEN